MAIQGDGDRERNRNGELARRPHLERGMRMMKGSITQILEGQQQGFILSEEGNEVYFNDEGVPGKLRDFPVGSWVEFEIQYGPEGPRAVNVKKVLARDEPRPAGVSRA